MVSRRSLLAKQSEMAAAEATGFTSVDEEEILIAPLNTWILRKSSRPMLTVGKTKNLPMKMER